MFYVHLLWIKVPQLHSKKFDVMVYKKNVAKHVARTNRSALRHSERTTRVRLEETYKQLTRTEKKAVKFLSKDTVIVKKDTELQVLPLILSDSKGKHLRKVSICKKLEDQITWWDESGRTLEEGLALLYEKREFLSKFSWNGGIHRVHVYCFLGTNDLTDKPGRFVEIRARDDAAVDRLIQNTRDIARYLDQLEIRFTFFPLPVFSIRKFNESRGHANPEIYIEDDKSLQSQLVKYNQEICRINSVNNVRGLQLNCDISRNSTNRSGNTSRHYAWEMFKDGIHPSNLLSRVWYTKIQKRILDDCYW